MTEPVIRHEDVAGYVLGSLTPEERAAFERHLDNCPSCREQVRELGVPAELVRRAAPAYDTPPDLRETTFAAIEREASEDGPRPSWAPRRPVWRRSLAVVAAATALVVGGVLAASVPRPPRNGAAGRARGGALAAWRRGRASARDRREDRRGA
jgi:anti-sigma factor RsiW